MSIRVRAAQTTDVEVLVRLRLTNAEWHVRLDPVAYRIPDPVAVRRHFRQVLAEPSGTRILVAEVDGVVTGMVELVPLPAPPDHQIAVPRPYAEIHTVILSGHRQLGIGRALVRAGEDLAAELGIFAISAPILTRNEGALRFYASAGFAPRGTILRKDVRSPSPG